MQSIVKKKDSDQGRMILLPKSYPEKLGIQSREGISFIKVSDILFCEADSNYTVIHLENSNKRIVSKTLRRVEEGLGMDFLRIHQSYLININKITAVGEKIQLCKTIHLPFSRSRKKPSIAAIKKKYTII